MGDATQQERLFQNLIGNAVKYRHGGRIWLESSPGEGSTFHFTLPCLTAVNEPGYDP